MRNYSSKIFAVLCLSFVVFSCSSGTFPKGGFETGRVPSSSGPEVAHVTYLDQGWKQADRQVFYYTAQGSNFMPYDWAKNMENADSQSAFLSNASLSRFGYIPQAPTAENPDGLPIGFTKDVEKKEAHLGMNCAACHTAQLTFHGQNIRIDGGQSMSDFQGFISAMDAAINATARDPDKFERFANRLLGAAVTEDAKKQLSGQLAELAKFRNQWEARNGTSMQYGHGRLDAFGNIFNQVLARDLKREKGGAMLVENRREADAPVSYPVLWDAPYHDIVQWIGIAKNNLEDKGPLSRNIGQVLGVFGHVDLDRETLFLGGYCSSAKRSNIERLETEVRSLWSPKWREDIFGKIDPAKAAQGARIYNTSCVRCHQLIDSRSPTRIIYAKMDAISEVKTDPKVAANAVNRTALTGQLKGKKLSVLEGRPMEAEEPATLVLRHAVAGALMGSISPITCAGEIDTDLSTVVKGWKNVAKKAASALFTKAEMENAGTLSERLALNADIFMRYKARPLNGIWASAPYLHNGSVKNLRELLLPGDQRSQEFTTGCSEFDEVNVGLKDCGEADGAKQKKFATGIPGNWRTGHEYGVNLTADDRASLLEYLKTL